MVPCRNCPPPPPRLRFCWEPNGDLRLARDPLGLWCLLGPTELSWPGPGDRSLKSLVLLHFLCREADRGLAGVSDPPTLDGVWPRGAAMVGEGDGAGDMELDPSVCMEEEEVYRLDLLPSLSLLLA